MNKKILIICSGRFNFVRLFYRRNSADDHVYLLVTRKQYAGFIKEFDDERVIKLKGDSFSPRNLPEDVLEIRFDKVYIVLNNSPGTGYGDVFELARRINVNDIDTVDYFFNIKKIEDFNKSITAKTFKILKFITGAVLAFIVLVIIKIYSIITSVKFNKNNIAIVSFFFPPLGSTGIHRVLNIIDNLLERGRDICVITPVRDAIKYFGVYEDDIEKIYSEKVKIIRSDYIDLDDIDFKYKRPDGQIGWMPFGIIKTINTVIKYRTKYLMVSCPPFSSAVFSYIVSILFGIKLIVDYRDLWIQNTHFAERLTFFDRWIEQKINRKADAILTISGYQRAQLIDADNNLKDKVFYVPRGYRDKINIPMTPIKLFEEGNKILRIIYTGIFYGGKRNPEVIFAGLNNLIVDKKIDRDRISIETAGPFEDEEFRLAEKYDLSDRLYHYGILKYSETLYLQSLAGILVVLTKDETIGDRAIMTGKVFEYITHRKFILGICCKEGDLYNLINDCGLGEAYGADAADGVEELLLKKYKEFCEKSKVEVNYNFDKLEKYKIGNLKIVDIMEKL